MTDRRPTGLVRPGPSGDHDLVLTRTFPGSVDDVWASITEPDRLARWYGSYAGETGPGRTVQVTMSAEEGAPTDPVLILACDPPHRLELQFGHTEPAWRVVITLAADGATTELTFSQTLAGGIDAADVGPGWEYYLDRLEAAERSEALPDWDDSYLEMADHYRSPG